MTRIVLVFSVAIALAQASADADLVMDFETTPGGGTPTDNQALVLPYVDSGGVTVNYGFDTDGDDVIDADAFFEQAGGTEATNGFLNNNLNEPDTADAGLEGQLGNFFLRSAGTTGVIDPGAAFIIDYGGLTNQLVTEASGEVWDIDGEGSTETEQFVATAYGLNGDILATQTSPLGTNTGAGSLDGAPWEFSFVGFNQQIDRIEITFTGSKTTGVGLAFNNHAIVTAAVPEPSSLILTGLVSSLFFGGGALRRRRNRASKAT